MGEFREARTALWEAVERARACEEGAVAVMERPAITMAMSMAKQRVRDLPPNADADQLQSMATEAVWIALSRVELSLDTAQIVRYLVDRAHHAVSDAARLADPLPRRARAARNRVIATAQARSLPQSDTTLRELTDELFPKAMPATTQLIVHGAPPMLDIDRSSPDYEPLSEDPGPAEQVLAEARTDAVHVMAADLPDPRFRAWAASVLCEENDGRRVPRALQPAADRARRRLDGWVS